MKRTKGNDTWLQRRFGGNNSHWRRLLFFSLFCTFVLQTEYIVTLYNSKLKSATQKKRLRRQSVGWLLSSFSQSDGRNKRLLYMMNWWVDGLIRVIRSGFTRFSSWSPVRLFDIDDRLVRYVQKYSLSAARSFICSTSIVGPPLTKSLKRFCFFSSC